MVCISKKIKMKYHQISSYHFNMSLVNEGINWNISDKEYFHHSD